MSCIKLGEIGHEIRGCVTEVWYDTDPYEGEGEEDVPITIRVVYTKDDSDGGDEGLAFLGDDLDNSSDVYQIPLTVEEVKELYHLVCNNFN